ncbi:MAG: beta-hydroxyacyl-ACP dehydratase [Planctomycetaceae bacterium]|nr:beta-hydroxyacyl-ACP dehydratase [Planctomycetaceae bacterium]
MRFLLVDRVTSISAGESITAVKNLSLAEEYLADHFPGFPVMPGVLMLEALVQTSAWLMRITEDFQFSTILLKEAKALKFNNFMKPGMTLHITSKVHKRSDREYTFKAEGIPLFDTKTTEPVPSAVSARITLEQRNLAEKAPEMTKADQMQIKEFRNLWPQVWTEK